MDGTNPPDIATQAEMMVLFSDAITWVSPTLPAGTPVDYTITMTLVDKFTYDQDDPFINAGCPGLVFNLPTDFVSLQSFAVISATTDGLIVDAPCHSASGGTQTAIKHSMIGNSDPLDGTLIADAHSDTYLDIAGKAYKDPADDVIADPPFGATFTIDVLTPGASFVSASGATYSSAPVPEPGRIVLMFGGAAVLALARRAKRASARLARARVTGQSRGL